MIYLTNYKYKTFIESLDVNIPFEYKKEFFNKYKLKNLNVDLSFFSMNEKKRMVISDMLFQDIANLNRLYFIRKNEKDNKELVFANSIFPAYHSDKDCSAMLNDYVNAKFPKSLKADRKEEYRQFIKDNQDRYKCDTAAYVVWEFCKEVKAKFHLTESEQEISSLFVRKNNSGYMAFCLELNLEQKIEEINSLWEVFVKNTKDKNEIDLAKLSFSVRKGEVMEHFENMEEMKKLYEQKLGIINRILAMHFYHAHKQGLELSEKILQLAGFVPCQAPCCKK